MRQYLDAKQQHRDAILFFRMGDFYEMFYEDALVAARALESDADVPLEGRQRRRHPDVRRPFHAVDGYIARLVKKGFRVAICDQVEDPRKAKGLVKREVVRVVSPGTLTDADYLDAREPAFLMAVAARRRSRPDASASRCSTSRPASSRRPSTRAPTACRRWPTRSPSCRPREIVVPRRPSTLADSPADGRRSRRPGHAGRCLDLRPRDGAPRAARPAPHGGASKASASSAGRPPSRRPARSSSTCAARRRSISRTFAPSRTGSAPTRC